jgi:glycerate-2-kinase
MSTSSLRTAAERIISAALRAADPESAVEKAISKGFPPVAGRLFLVAVGKASAGMAGAALRILGNRVTEGIVVQPRGYERAFDGARAMGAISREILSRILVLESSHPVPDQGGLDAARRVDALIAGMEESDTCLFLLSGGGSSLLPLPLDPVTLEEKSRTTELLLRSGADIREINTVRKHLSATKGGRLALKCKGTILTYAISDVVGDDPGSIASGPTVPDPTTYADARDVLARYGILGAAPASVRRLLDEGARGALAETPKSLPPRHGYSLIASNRIAVDAAAAEAARAGFPPLVLSTFLTGEAREAGRFLSGVVREVKARGRPGAAPLCLLMGGETTVTIKGSGHGGRNQELALAAAVELAGVDGFLVGAFATDGKEGNTNAAGAFADGGTVMRGRNKGLDPRASLSDNDSGTFLAAAEDLVTTGPTGTNVNDIAVALIEPDA